MLQIIIISAIILALAIVGLGIQIFFSRKKKFPEIHIGHNKEMRKRNIYCAQTEQKIIDKQNNNSNLNTCGENCGCMSEEE